MNPSENLRNPRFSGVSPGQTASFGVIGGVTS
jgi:hypothetical protein